MKKVIFLSVLFQCFVLSSQNGIDNDKAHRRYWYYRARLINDFIKIGKDQGDCMLMAERNYGSPTSSICKIGPDQMDITNHYIMALALEYKLLTRGNQMTDETVKELWHMLYAINRLDGESNQLWASYSPPLNYYINQTSAPDGFLMREDMPPTYYSNNYNHFNYTQKLYNPTNDPLKSYTGLEPVSTVEGNFQNLVFPSPTNTLTAQERRDDLGIPTDKIHSMLVAMLFVIKYLPDNVYYYEAGNPNPMAFQDNAISLKQEAKNISERLYKYMKSGFVPNSNTWILQYPDYNGPAPIGNGHILNVGAFADIYSYPLTRMACNANHGFPYVFANLSCLANGYADLTANGPGVSTYISQAITPGANTDNAIFKAWDHIGSNMPADNIPIAAAMQGNTTYWNIKWASLARMVLHQTDKINVAESDYTNAIAQAPCTGPYNFGSCNMSGCEFSAQDWLEKPKKRGAGCINCNNNEGVFPGNYPGVDYMLLHNLYYEYHNQLLFDNNLGNTGGIGSNIYTAGSTLGIGSNLAGNGYIFYYNLFTNIGNSATAGVNAVTTTICNALNSVSNFFGGNNVCTGTSIPPVSTIPTGNSVAPYSTLAYTGYNLMDNYDNSIWPRQIYNGPQPPSIPGNGPLSNSNPNSPNNPNNPNSPYNPNNPNGYYNNASNFTFQGTNQSQAKVGMYQNLTSTAHIYAITSPAAPFNTVPSDVRYRAGNEITLLPGFQVDAGSNFYAYVKRYLCNVDGNNLEMRQANPNEVLDDNAHYETDFINQLPIHYVEHPKSDADNNPVVYNEIRDTKNLNEQEIRDLIQEQLVEKQLADQGIYNSNKNLDQRFLITPNPNNGIFTVYVNKIADDEIFSISILDMKGSEIKTLTDINTNLIEEINLTEYSKGIYMIKLFSNKGFNANKKISVN